MTRRLVVLTFIVVTAVALWPSEAAAQRGRGGDGRGRGPVIIATPQRTPTVVYPPYYGPWGWGYPGQYPYPYPYPYRGYRYDDSASVRVEVTPRETEVYVDGARAGIVDDYDGIFQRLHVTPGEHEITLYLAGYRTWREVRYFSPNGDSRILHTMLQLAPGQPDEPRPVPIRREPRDIRDPRDRDQDDDDRQPRRPADRPLREPPPPAQPRIPAPPDQPGQPPQPAQPPRPAEPPAPPTPPAPRDMGTLSVAIDPADADITLDGKRISLQAGDNRLIVQLSEGVHRLVIHKAGFQTWETDLQIRRGRTLAFSVSLVK